MRVRACNTRRLRPDGDHVLYWMIAARRTRRSHALQRAVRHARELGRPLVVLEALRAGYPHASDRLHRFVLDGMRDNAAAFREAGVAYHAYVEPSPGAGRGLLEALAERACVVVTDDFPAFFLPRMVRAAAAKLPVLLEAVDSNGLVPLAATDRLFESARGFRSFVQKSIPSLLADFPEAEPLAGVAGLPRGAIPAEVASRWPAASAGLLEGDPSALAALPIDHRVGAVETPGGPAAGRDALERFIERRLSRYAEDRNHPDRDATSGLSPYLHFGHLSAHDVFDAVTASEAWHPGRLGRDARGARAGWWGLSPSAEGFLDQLLVWRELGGHRCAVQPECDRYETLPEWSRRSLAARAGDARPHLYDLEALEGAATHDRVWNAAQTQLVREGRMHNYLRMLWGKRILEWSRTPGEAFERMLLLNDRWALDGRDPNSVSGVAWVLGRYDRPWGPARPIFGTVRYMSSANTMRKLEIADYLERYAP